MISILVIEDDTVTAEEIGCALQSQGYEVHVVSGGEAGLRLAASAEYDAITLDRMLPGIDGLAVASALKAKGVDTPVLMISALSEVDERVKGLRAGGDDYLVKPFAMNEMVARVEVLLRRRRADSDKRVLRLADLEMDLLNRVAQRGERDLRLAPKEFKLLELLVRNSGQVLTRSMIFEQVWGYTFDPGTNLIDVHVRALRGKLEEAGKPALLQTVRGSGYRLHAD